MSSDRSTRVERRFLSCMYPFTYKSPIFLVRQSEQMNSIRRLSHFDISVFSLFRGFVALALVPPGTDPASLYMDLPDRPAVPMFKMPSILIWFGLVGEDIRHVHVPRYVEVADGSILCWYYSALPDMPPSLVSWFGASVGMNFEI
jgi:hypothetical protein